MLPIDRSFIEKRLRGARVALNYDRFDEPARRMVPVLDRRDFAGHRRVERDRYKTFCSGDDLPAVDFFADRYYGFGWRTEMLAQR